ncbi:unnamed protein product [Brassica oleracea var. botrytis]
MEVQIICLQGNKEAYSMRVIRTTKDANIAAIIIQLIFLGKRMNQNLHSRYYQSKPRRGESESICFWTLGGQSSAA